MIHFTGAGCGSPDLITLRGAQQLQKADVVIYAGSLVNPELLSLCRKDCRIYDSARLTLEEILSLMKQYRDKEVVRLHTGDPSLYGAIKEQMDLLEQEGIPFDVTPGVSSFLGAAASLPAEYTVPGISQSLILTRMAGRTKVPESESIHALASHGASMAVFLSAGMLEGLQKELLSGAYTEDTPAAIVYKATWPEERILRCRLGDLAKTGEDAGIRNTALILVGDFLQKEGERSKLYDPSFSTGFRKAKESSAGDIRILSFTDRGEALAGRLASILPAKADRGIPAADWTKQHFPTARALVFIGAAGIAVRSAALYLRSKAEDPAILVLDEDGRFVVPLLGGHLGGANELARKIAGLLGAQAVITTATDTAGVFAVDEWARCQGLALLEPERILPVSSALLRDGNITVTSDFPIQGASPSGVRTGEGGEVLVSLHTDDSQALHLVPRIGALGIGCKKGIRAETIETVFAAFLKEHRLSEKCITGVYSIDRKAKEPGILSFCRRHGWPFTTFSAEELSAVPGSFSASSFVLDAVGVDNVCERAAVLGSGGKLAAPKYTGNGVSLALAEAPFAPDWRWKNE